MLRKVLFSLSMLLALAGCATVPPASDREARIAYEEARDPLEPLNRATFQFNQLVEDVLIRPTAKVYRFLIPQPARDAISRALDNLKTPFILANDLLQGEGKRGGVTLGRFVVNSTLGVGGLFDVAQGMGMERHGEDFGQTLAVWGVGEGPYIVWPVLGPSTLRDAVGRTGTVAMDPLFWVLRSSDLEYLSYIRTGLSGVDTYERNAAKLSEMRRSSLDYYAAMRNAYRQHRRNEVLNGALVDPELPDYLFEEDEVPESEHGAD